MRFAVGTVLLCFVLVAGTLKCFGEPAPSLRLLFPAGTFQANVVRPSFSKQAKELEDKMKIAIRNQPEWWLEYVRKNARVRPLPYNTNFGITELEYKRLLKIYESKGLDRYGSITLQCKHEPEGRIVLSSDNLPKSIVPLIFSTVTLDVETPLGKLTKPEVKEVSGADDGGVFGPNTSYRWYVETGTIESGNFEILDLSVHVRKSDQHVFLYFKGQQMQGFEIKNNFEMLLEFEQDDANTRVALNGNPPALSRN